jgi:hypothetical protein
VLKGVVFLAVILGAFGLIASARAEPQRQVAPDSPVVIMDTSRVTISVLEVKSLGARRHEAITRDEGQTIRSSYARREVDCAMSQVRTLVEAGSLDGARQPRPRGTIVEWHRLVDGSAQHRLARFVCNNEIQP